MAVKKLPDGGQECLQKERVKTDRGTTLGRASADRQARQRRMGILKTDLIKEKKK